MLLMFAWKFETPVSAGDYGEFMEGRSSYEYKGRYFDEEKELDFSVSITISYLGEGAIRIHRSKEGMPLATPKFIGHLVTPERSKGMKVWFSDDLDYIFIPFDVREPYHEFEGGNITLTGEYLGKKDKDCSGIGRIGENYYLRYIPEDPDFRKEEPSLSTVEFCYPVVQIGEKQFLGGGVLVPAHRVLSFKEKHNDTFRLRTR